MDTNGNRDSCRGVSDLWNVVNHIALVVSDVGKSLQFYTDIVGLKQVLRPDFDRHGAWLTFGNVDLHLIKGPPAVHSDDDLIVSHIAIETNDMKELRERLARMGVKSRRNISVPNPGKANKAVVDQAFVRDPDGYYIEFCNCATLDEFFHQKSEATEELSVSKAVSLLKAKKIIQEKVERSKLIVRKRLNTPSGSRECSDNEDEFVTVEGLEPPAIPASVADPGKLKNLIKRREIYGDITQNVTERKLESLLKRWHNDVPAVIEELEQLVAFIGKRKLIPPAFYDKDGNLYQPPSFMMEVKKNSVENTKNAGDEVHDQAQLIVPILKLQMPEIQ